MTRLLAALFACAMAAPLQSQELSVRAGAGTVIPVGGAAEDRDLGPTALLSVEIPATRRFTVRVDGEWSLLDGADAPPGSASSSQYQNLRIAGVSLNAVRRANPDRPGGYFVFGIGAYRLQRTGAIRSVYGTTAAVQMGTGIERRFGRAVPFAEARAQLHVTDYGSNEFTPTIVLPLVLGLRIL